MKNIPCKDGIVFYYVKKYRRRRLITIILLLAVLLVYVFFSRAYFANAFCGPGKLDIERFATEADVRPVGEAFELHRSDSTTIEAYALRATSYWQDTVYEFDVKLSNPKVTQIAYTTANTDPTIEDASMKSAVLYRASIGGIETLVLAYPHHKLSDGDVVSGVFTEIPHIINYDIANSDEFEADSQICRFMLDIRGISMESQFFDILICTLLLMLILYLSVRLIIQYINPFTSPTYSQLYKYGETGDVVESIERQLAKVIHGKKITEQIVTENWIVTRDTFKLKIVKNHMQKH